MNKNVVFITAITDPNRPERAEPYQYCIQSWKGWCQRNDVQLFVLDEPLIENMKPNYFRYYCFDLLESNEVQYDQICLVDADTIVHPNCPNFFELTDQRFTAVHNDGDYDWIIRSVENYQYEFPEFGESFDIWKYFNSGFLVINKSHKKIFEDLLAFYWRNENHVLSCQKRYGVGSDQPLVNLLVNSPIDGQSRVPIKLLDYRFNMQDLPRKNALENFLFLTIPGIYHYNAIPGNAESTTRWMKETSKRLN